MINLTSIILSILVVYVNLSNTLAKLTFSLASTQPTASIRTTTTITTGTINPIDLELHDAAWNGDYTAVLAAIQAGGNVNSMGPKYRNYNSTSPLFDLLNNRHNNCNITNLLISAGANLNYKNNYGYTALISASRLGFIDIVNILIKAGSAIDTGDANGQTALMTASVNGFTNVMTALITAGANVNKTDFVSRSALTLATIASQSAAVKLLVDANANVNNRDNLGGLTPMMWASQYGYLSIVHELCMEGADINAQATDTKRTALMFASQNNQVATVDFLLQMGCDVNTRDITGYTALKWAKMYRRNNTISILLRYNATI